VFTYDGSTCSTLASITGVDGRTLETEDTLFVKVGREGISAIGSAGSGAPLEGPRVAVIAATIVGRTLKFFNCFFKSDFAAFGAFLWKISACCQAFRDKHTEIAQ